MGLAVWAFIFHLACVATKRIHVSHQLGRASSESAESQAPKEQPPKQPSGLKGNQAPQHNTEAIPLSEQPAAGPPQSSPPVEHFWARRGGNQRMDSDVPWTAPSDFSRGPSWTWDNPLGEQVRHSPLIDKNFDIYITTGVRIRKFHGRTGAMLWTWESPGADEQEKGHEMSACPVLDGDAILTVVPGPSSLTVFSLSLATGVVNWKREHVALQNGDASAMLAQNGTLVFAIRNPNHPLDELDSGPRKLLAVDTSDGSHRWDYEMDGVVWNFSPASPSDGTLLFASSCGTAYRLDFNGRLLWESSWDVPLMCSAGGGALGPDGVFYISWSYAADPLPHPKGNNFAAINISDGARLWSKTITFGDGAAQYPAVGKLGEDGPLAMVVIVGDQPAATDGLPNQPKDRVLRNAVVALDAKTGAELWFSEEAPWPHPAGAGDEQSSLIPRIFAHPTLGPTCYPDAQGIPLITGDGTVYASSSHHGDLRAIRTTTDPGPIPMLKAAETSVFRPGVAFLNSPSTAPGMLVAAPCWGPTFVWLSEE